MCFNFLKFLNFLWQSIRGLAHFNHLQQHAQKAMGPLWALLVEGLQGRAGNTVFIIEG
jgi:ABC-type polysaccharide/polyol phosphate export permease